MRSFLDRLYAAALVAAATCLVAIATLVGAQVLGRIYDNLLQLFGYPPYGFLVASLAEIAGYLLTGASFLALAATLKRGAHIRVTILLHGVPERLRRVLELWALAAGAAFTAFMCVQLVRLAADSYRFNEVSYGIIPVPLAIPQAVMAFGAIVLLVALIDEIVIGWREGGPSFLREENAATGAKEG